MARTASTATARTTNNKAAEVITQKENVDVTPIDQIELRKFIAKFMPTMNEKERKAFAGLSMAAKHEFMEEAFRAEQAKDKPARVYATKVTAHTERVGIELEDGTITHIVPLAKSANKGPARPGTERGDTLAAKRIEAMMLGGKVVKLSYDNL